MEKHPSTAETRNGRIEVTVSDQQTGAPFVNAAVAVYQGRVDKPKYATPLQVLHTGTSGTCTFEDLVPGPHTVMTDCFGQQPVEHRTVTAGCTADVNFKVPLNVTFSMQRASDCGDTIKQCTRATVDQPMILQLDHNKALQPHIDQIVFMPSPGILFTPLNNEGNLMEARFSQPGMHTISSQYRGKLPTFLPAFGASTPIGPFAPFAFQATAGSALPQPIAGNVGVTLKRTSSNPTADQVLWVAIRNRTKSISFNGYREFVDRVFCPQSTTFPTDPRLRRQLTEFGTSFYGVGAYELLQTATEVFLLLECSVKIDPKIIRGVDILNEQDESNRLGRTVNTAELRSPLLTYLSPGRLPYLDRVIDAAFPQNDTGTIGIICEGILTARANTPCLLELIWSYWHEEGMLVQSVGAITRRFQNLRAPGERDPLSHLELDPLRPLNNIIWGYIQDEQHRLSVKRRAYEYDHHYGLSLIGKAVNGFRPADTRSKFLEAFHNLLHRSAQFFKEDNDTTVISDGFRC